VRLHIRQGRGGFRDFPQLADGEGESQQQPPDPAHHSWLPFLACPSLPALIETKRRMFATTGVPISSYTYKGILMSQPSHELQHAESAMQSVLDYLVDSQEAFQEIGDKLQDETLKRYFLAESLKRAEFRGEIESVLHREGVRDIKESGTAAGTVHRVWAGLKSKLGGGDRTLLVTAEEGEDETAAAYERAMDTYLPLPVRQLLTTQAAHIKLSHDYIRAACNRKS
jgi:uncharacterized protein (TIGR02284 family)